MAFVYIPIDQPNKHGRTGYYQHYYPGGTDVRVECEKQGWKADFPTDADVYDDQGHKLHTAPVAAKAGKGKQGGAAIEE